MILKDWQIKVLQHYLLDYERWINHVETVRKEFKGVEGDLMFPNPDAIIQNKVNACFERMLKQYSHLNEYSYLDFSDLTDEEKVDLITSPLDYENREARDIKEKNAV